MAAIDFPSSPSNGDTHTVGGVTYTYNSAETKWKTTINSNAFLALSGGNVTGNLSVDTDTLFVDASTDRVGIGEASPNRQLVVNGGTSEGVIQITNDTSGTAVANGFELIHFTNGETQLLNRENGAMRFDTNGTERMRILAAGGLTFNGDTAAANALDDYEEGTWTATIKSGSNTISRSGGTAEHFTYTKIGNQVTVYFVLDGVTTSGTTGGVMRVDGLPYSPSVGTNWRTVGPPCFFYGSGFRAAHWPIYPHLNHNSATIQFYYKNGVTDNYNETTVGQVGSGSYVFFQVTYQVD